MIAEAEKSMNSRCTAFLVGTGWLAVPDREKEVGAIICRLGSGDDFEIVYVIVDERSRNRGIGLGLVAVALEAALSDGHQKVSCRVPTTYPEMHHLFLGLSFVPVGIVQLGGRSVGGLVILERDLGDWLDDELLPEGRQAGRIEEHGEAGLNDPRLVQGVPALSEEPGSARDVLERRAS